tara:strand:- start:459 stop:1091 length:633 start_codon:yes stop_codon:yes gene_type:complete
MSLNKDGVIVILSSPSGAGKTTLVKKISSLIDFTISISYTTRIPRINEVNGKDYYFINRDQFNDLVTKDEFLEYAKVFDNYYGSSKKKVFDLLKKGQNVIFDIDWQGAKQIKDKNLNFKLITFFILPPSKKTLKSRLAERENNNKSIIDERMEKFNDDIKHWVDYDYVVINDDLEICLNNIVEIIRLNNKNEKVDFDKKKIQQHIKFLLK